MAGIRVTEPLDAMASRFPDCHTSCSRTWRSSRTTTATCATSSSPSSRASSTCSRPGSGSAPPPPPCGWRPRWSRRASSSRRRPSCGCSRPSSTSSSTPSSTPRPRFKAIAKGLNASPGAAVGAVYFTADDAEEHAQAGEKVILVRPETSPDDLHGMIAAEGILTSRGGLVSHAAVVARGMGKPAICGAEAVKIDLKAKQFKAGDVCRQGRRHHLHLRHHRGDRPRRGAGHHARADRALRHRPRLRRPVPHASRSAPTPTRRRTPPGPGSSAPRASACAAPSTCSSARTGWPSSGG